MYVWGKKEDQPLELDVFNQGMSKTELCNKWQQTGAFPYGEHCQFAHGIGELRPVLRHPRYKAEVCRMVLAGDHCPYGHCCHFRHSLTEEETLMGQRIAKRSLKLWQYVQAHQMNGTVKFATASQGMDMVSKQGCPGR